MNRAKKQKYPPLFIAGAAAFLLVSIGIGTAYGDILDDAYLQLDQNPPAKRSIQSVDIPTLITWVLGKRGCSIKNRYQKDICTTAGKWVEASTKPGYCFIGWVVDVNESDCKAKKASGWTNGLPDEAYCQVYVTDFSGKITRSWSNQDTKSECTCDWTHACFPGDHERWVEAVPDYCDDRKWDNQKQCESDGYWHDAETYSAYCTNRIDTSPSVCGAAGQWFDETNSPDHCSDGTTKTLRECERAAQEQMKSLPRQSQYCITYKNDTGQDIRDCRQDLNFIEKAGRTRAVGTAYRIASNAAMGQWDAKGSKPEDAPGFCIDGSSRDSLDNSCVDHLNAHLTYSGDDAIDLPNNHKLVKFKIVGETAENMFAPDTSTPFAVPPNGDRCECDKNTNNADCTYSPYSRESLECEGRSCSVRAPISPVTSYKSSDCYDEYKQWNIIVWPPSVTYESRYYRVHRVPKFEIEPLNLTNIYDPRYSDAEYARLICFGNQYKLPERNGDTTTYWIDVTGEKRVYSSKYTPSDKPNIACNIKIQSPFYSEVLQFGKTYAGTIYQSVNFAQLPEITEYKWDGAVASQEGNTIKMFRNHFKTTLSWKTIAAENVDIIERTSTNSEPKKLVSNGSPNGSITLDEMDYGIHSFQIVAKSKDVPVGGDTRSIVVSVIDPPLLAEVGAARIRVAGKDGIRFTVFAQGATNTELRIETSGLYQLLNGFGTNKVKYTPERHPYAEPYYFYYDVTADQKDTTVTLDAWNTNANNGESVKERKPIVSYHVDLSNEADKCKARLRGAVLAKATASAGASAVATLETGPFALLFGAFGLVYGGYRGADDIEKNCNANPNYNPGPEFLYQNLLPFDDKVILGGVKADSGGNISAISSGLGAGSSQSIPPSFKHDTSQLPKSVGDTMLDTRSIGAPVVSPDLWVDSDLSSPSLGQTSEDIKLPDGMETLAEPLDM